MATVGTTTVQDSVTIKRSRYQHLMEDAQALTQIVFLTDTHVAGNDFVDTVQEIVNEWRNSRYGT